MTPFSQPYTNIGRKVKGYMVNTGLSHETLNAIQLVRQDLDEAFPGVFYFPPLESLHVTLLDWFDPLYEYSEPLTQLYERLHDEYDAALKSALHRRLPITVEFDTVRVSAGAVFIEGEDDGQFNGIRQDFLARVTLLPGMKPPPKIIHSSIARFKTSVNLHDIDEALQGIGIEAIEKVQSFRLVEERETPMLDYRIIYDYQV